MATTTIMAAETATANQRRDDTGVRRLDGETVAEPCHASRPRRKPRYRRGVLREHSELPLREPKASHPHASRRGATPPQRDQRPPPPAGSRRPPPPCASRKASSSPIFRPCASESRRSPSRCSA